MNAAPPFQLFFIFHLTDAVFIRWHGRLAFSVLFLLLKTNPLQKMTRHRTEKNNSYWKDIDCIPPSKSLVLKISFLSYFTKKNLNGLVL